MAHSNHYYAQQLQEGYGSIDLIAVEENNKIKVVVGDSPVYDEKAVVTLTEQEQDDLIVGILERRGYINITTLVRRLAGAPIQMLPITAEGSMQSRIHPAKLPG